MYRFALLLLLAACTNGNGDDDTGDDTGPVEDADGDGFTIAEGDCDDDDETRHPDATEVYYDGVDQDCSGGSDDDADGDGFDAEAEGGDDCDDTDPTVNPDATEVYYDGEDGNCDGESDYDADGDGYDASTHGGFDCDDTKPLVHPDAEELCSTAWDDDCDAATNEADATDAPTWYLDDDGDTFGSPDAPQKACTQPAEHVADDTDCNDDPEVGVGDVIYPGAPDVACDGFDNDCDPLTFEAAAILVDDVVTAGDLAAVLALGSITGGEVVTLCEGKHTVQNATIADGITLEGKGQGLTILEAPQIDIDAGAPVVLLGAPLLRVGTSAAVEITDLTLTGGGGFEVGNNRHGGGLFVADNGYVSVSDVTISGNGSGFGSGIYAGTDAALTLLRVTIADNVGDDAAAFVYPIGGGLYLDADATLSMHDTTIRDNEAEIGGGIYAKSGVSITATGRSIVSGNDGGLTGGGLDLGDACSVSGLTISGNTAVNGGGVHANDTTVAAAHVTITDTIITGNVTSNIGGGLTALGLVDLDRVQLVDNITTFNGGNLHASGDSTTVTMNDGAVRGGGLTSGLGDGGGVYLNDATLACTDVDFGTGATDNEKEDVWLDASLAGPAGKQGFFGADTTFVLDDELGGCYPEIGETCN